MKDALQMRRSHRKGVLRFVAVSCLLILAAFTNASAQSDPGKKVKKDHPIQVVEMPKSRQVIKREDHPETTQTLKKGLEKKEVANQDDHKQVEIKDTTRSRKPGVSPKAGKAKDNLRSKTLKVDSTTGHDATFQKTKQLNANKEEN